MKNLWSIVTLVVFFSAVAEAQTASVYPDFSKSTCEVVHDSQGARIIVRGVQYAGYGFWIAGHWNPYNLSFDLLPDAQFGVEHLPNGVGGQACTLTVTDPGNGNRAELTITPNAGSGSLTIDAVPLDGGMNLYLTTTYVSVHQDNLGFEHRTSTAGNGWGGAGWVLPGNTYRGLVLYDFVTYGSSANSHPDARPDFSRPFQFCYWYDSLQGTCVQCGN